MSIRLLSSCFLTRSPSVRFLVGLAAVYKRLESPSLRKDLSLVVESHDGTPQLKNGSLGPALLLPGLLLHLTLLIQQRPLLREQDVVDGYVDLDDPQTD